LKKLSTAFKLSSELIKSFCFLELASFAHEYPTPAGASMYKTLSF